MRGMGIVRRAIKTEEFDYGSLMWALSSYKKPRDALSRFIDNDSIVRVKKGLYVFGEDWRRGIICKESLANLIYGPSYLSLEYALSYYGLIPERVEQITSMTSLRSKLFHTPLGVFAYVHLNPEKMAVGVTSVKVDRYHEFLIATPEKALADRISSHKNLTSKEEVYAFVCEGLRIDEEALSQLELSLLIKVAEVYRNPAVTQLAHLVKELK